MRVEGLIVELMDDAANAALAPAVRCPTEGCNKLLIRGTPRGAFTVACKRCKAFVSIRETNALQPINHTAPGGLPREGG